MTYFLGIDTGGTFTESEGDVAVGLAAPFTDEDARAEGFESLAEFILTWESI